MNEQKTNYLRYTLEMIFGSKYIKIEGDLDLMRKQLIDEADHEVIRYLSKDAGYCFEPIKEGYLECFEMSKFHMKCNYLYELECLHTLKNN
jgi:hypothetical protein